MSARRPRVWIAAAAVAALLAALDSAFPAHSPAARAAVALIHGYGATLARPLGALGVRCRFEPTCSRYAAAALRDDGALRGGGRALWRLLRCGPWTEPGTLDPP